MERFTLVISHRKQRARQVISFMFVMLIPKKGSIKVGIMICYDKEFSESARVLMLKGAEIIFDIKKLRYWRQCET